MNELSQHFANMPMEDKARSCWGESSVRLFLKWQRLWQAEVQFKHLGWEAVRNS